MTTTQKDTTTTPEDFTYSEAYSVAVQLHLLEQFCDLQEEITEELKDSGLSETSRELLGELVAGGGLLEALRLHDYIEDTDDITIDDIDLDCLLEDHKSEPVLETLQWLENGEEIRARLYSITASWTKDVFEATR